MLSISFTFSVLKPDIFIDSSPQQSPNIQYILVTFDVLKFETSRNLRSAQS